MKASVRSTLGLCLFASATALATASAHAQTRDDENDIVVSARKVDEKLLDVPISIEAFSDREIARKGISNVDTLARYSTSIDFDKGANPESATITIRGLSPTRGRSNVAILIDGIDVTTEAIGAAGGGGLLNSRLLDVERIEVVRGPQSVLYGRSAFAGGIQYVTRTPSDTFEARAAFEAGNADRYSGRASVSGPIVDGLLSLGIVGSAWTEGGFYRDQATLSRLGGGHGQGAALIASLTPAPGLSFKGRLEYFKDNYAPQAQYILRSNTGLLTPSNNAALAKAFAAGVISSSAFATYHGVIPNAGTLPMPQHSPDPLTGKRFEGSHMRVVRGSLISNYETGMGTFTSWTGYTDTDYSNRQDFDQDGILSGPIGNQIDTSNRTSIQDSSTYTEQFSQELRYTSAFEGPFQLTVGGLYWQEDSARDSRSGTVACAATIPECANGAAGRVPFVGRVPERNSRSTRHWSAYGGLDWKATPQLSASLSGRYSWEKEEVMGSNCGLPVNSFGIICGDPFATSRNTPSVFGPGVLLSDGRTMASTYSKKVYIDSSDKFFTPRLSIDWKPDADTMAYASIAKGVKPGGTSTLGGGAWFDSDLDGDTDELSYKAENLWSYEVGVKKNWAGGRVQTNLSAFYMNYTDKQVVISRTTPSGSNASTIENAGKARVWGIEFEGRWSLTRNFNLGLNYTFLDPKYVEFLLLTDTKGNIIDAGNCTPVDKVCQVDYSGHMLENTSRHSLVGAINYSVPVRISDSLDDTSLFFESNTSYNSKRFIDQANRRQLKPYSLTDIRFGVRAPKWEVLAYVENLFDDDTIRSANTKTGDVDRVVLNLSVSTGAVLVNLPDPRTYGLRLNFRY